MAHKAVFAGLIFDENDNPVQVTYVGKEATYIVDDMGFQRHIPSEYVDMQVLNSMREMIEGHEGIISEQAAKMLGQDDIFSKALIETQLKQLDDQFDKILEVGLPEESRSYMGMMGFRVTIDLHGDVIEINQPGMIDPEDE